MKWWLLLCSVLTFHSLAETDSLHPKLEPFRPYINTYWIGDLTEPGKSEKTIDKSHWSRALNGQAIKVVHSVNNGLYGGESLIFWDEKLQSLSYYYFTTAGFYTHGQMQIDAKTGAIVATEQVENNQQGITQVKSRSLLSGDSLSVQSDYEKQGQWVKGHSASYRRVNHIEIIFQ